MKQIYIRANVPEDFEELDREQQAYHIANDGQWAQVSGEPVAVIDCADVGDYHSEWFAELLPDAHQIADLKVGTPLYKAPQTRELSDGEIVEIAKHTKTADPSTDGYILPVSFARAIEAALKGES